MEHRIMTDKDVSEKKLSENNQAEKQEVESALSNENSKPSSSPTGDKASTSKTETSVKKATPTANINSNKNNKETKPSNKTATVALIAASISIAASIGHYFWQQQQNAAQLTSINQQNQQALQTNQVLLKKALTTEFHRLLEQQKNNSQSKHDAKQAHLNSDAQVQLLSTQLSQLEQQVSLRQPNDWLIHEAEYLVRIAARTMWLERDTKAAISLLRDADNRLKELNQPKFLPVRALINEDIEALALMPTLKNQEVILTLMALNKQVPILTLANVNLAKALDAPKEDFSLSEDIDDWQENLAKTWQNFLKDFITVRRRTGMVEPLMSPQQQQHLKQNLSLKVQLVQWAASEQKAEVYQQTLLDIQQWLNEFFDMDLPANQRFYQTIEQLKQQTVYYDYPSDLRSLTAIKRLLDNTKQGVQPQASKAINLDKSNTDKIIAKDVDQTSEPEDKKPAEKEQTSGGQL